MADGELQRVMVFMPPRHSKSETVSRLFTAYYLYRHPDRFVGLASYAADLAYTLSRSARTNFVTAGGQLSGAAKAVKHWQTDQGGGMWATGVGGPATGKGFHLGIVDDPLKNAEEAASEAIQNRNNDWWDSVFSTREEPGGAIVLLLTRWNEKDTAGYVLSMEADEPEHWHIVTMPAIAEETDPERFPATCTLHPDWRAPGAALCPERYPLERLVKLAKRIGEYFFAALFQQRPRPRSGGMFKRDYFPIIEAMPAQVRRVRYWDKAGADEGKGDYTVGVLIAKTREGQYIVEDVVRGQWKAAARNTVIRQTAELDRRRGRVAIWVEQPPGLGKEASDTVIKLLSGFSARANPVKGDKVERADPFAAQCQAGNVSLLRGDWNKAYIEELCAFPRGTNDDQVDGSSGAFLKLQTAQLSSNTMDWNASPQSAPAAPPAARTPDEIEDLLGSDDDDITI